jgi:HPt (histidine-containing phosphotransfer) domain-containing protein
MGLTAEALGRLRDAVGDDDLIVADILQSFVDEVDSLLDKLSAAAQTDDRATLRRVAHTLKSSCRELGDHRTGAMCADLEDGSHSGGTSDATVSAAAISTACRELKQEVQRHIHSLQVQLPES